MTTGLEAVVDESEDWAIAVGWLGTRGETLQHDGGASVASCMSCVAMPVCVALMLWQQRWAAGCAPGTHEIAAKEGSAQRTIARSDTANLENSLMRLP